MSPVRNCYAVYFQVLTTECMHPSMMMRLTVPTFAVRETDVSRHNGGTSDAPLKPLRDDSALRTPSTLRGLRGAPEVAPLCRETQSLGQQMLNATVGINGLS